VAVPIAERRFAGVVLVARDGRVVFRNAYGMADAGGKIAHTPETPFMVMSVSKQFTAALIARLVVAGKLRLDDPVSQYLEHWPVEWNDVQVRHLLAHSSGLDIDTTYFWLIKHHPEYWPEAGSRRSMSRARCSRSRERSICMRTSATHCCRGSRRRRAGVRSTI